MTAHGPVVRRVVLTELAEFLLAPRRLHLLPVLGAGIVAVSLEFPAPPLIAAVVVALAALEPQFNNILFRTRSELQAMSLLPAPAHAVLAAKNVATIVLSVAVTLFSASVLAFFSGTPPTAGQAGDAALYLSTLLFPLLLAGNTRSMQYPRRMSGWRTDDLVEGTGFLALLAVLSLPWLILVGALEQRLLCAAYAGMIGFLWWTRGLPFAAQRLERTRTLLCSRP